MNIMNRSEIMTFMIPRHRLFFALRPPDAAAPYFVEEQRCFGPGRLVRTNIRIFTTAILDDYPAYPSAAVKRMIAAADAIAADRFPIVLDQVAASPHTVVMCPSEPLREFGAFHRLLANSVRGAGLKTRAGWRFSPHVTLLYRHGASLREWTDALSWTATEFVLIHSLVGLTRHEILARWPLHPPIAQGSH